MDHTILRKKTTGEPGNGGQFGNPAKPVSDVTLERSGVPALGISDRETYLYFADAEDGSGYRALDRDGALAHFGIPSDAPDATLDGVVALLGKSSTGAYPPYRSGEPLYDSPAGFAELDTSEWAPLPTEHTTWWRRAAAWKGDYGTVHVRNELHTPLSSMGFTPEQSGVVADAALHILTEAGIDTFENIPSVTSDGRLEIQVRVAIPSESFSPRLVADEMYEAAVRCDVAKTLKEAVRGGVFLTDDTVRAADSVDATAVKYAMAHGYKLTDADAVALARTVSEGIPSVKTLGRGFLTGAGALRSVRARGAGDGPVLGHLLQWLRDRGI